MKERGWPQILMYSATHCSDCRRSKALLKRLGVPYVEVNIDHDASAAAEVLRLNGGRRTLPTFVIAGRTVLAEPSDRELARALGVAL
ncbi:MAG: glutaredoxin family protein [Dehalococcoidia bacterium]